MNDNTVYLRFYLFYLQGMNEILGPIYYTFASDPEPECEGKW